MAITKIIQKTNNLSIIIPTAGMSRRMKKGPRALLDIGEEKLLSRQLRILRKSFPNSDLIVVVGYGAEAIYPIIPKFVRCVENELYETTNVSRSIALGMRVCTTDEILIIYGDLVFSRTTFNIPHNSALYINVNGKADTVGINIENEKAAHLSYASEIKWGQSLYLKGRELELFKKVAYNKENSRLCGHEIINKVVDGGGEFEVIKAGPIIELDTLSDILRVKLSEEKL